MCKLYIFMNSWGMHSTPLCAALWGLDVYVYAVCKSPEVGVTIENEKKNYMEPLQVTRSLSSLWPIGAPGCFRKKEGAFVPHWRCYLQSSHCTGKRFYFLPGCTRTSEAHVCAPVTDHEWAATVWWAGGLCTDFLWKRVCPFMYWMPFKPYEMWVHVGKVTE